MIGLDADPSTATWALPRVAISLGVAGAVPAAPLVVRKIDIDLRWAAEVPGEQSKRMGPAPERPPATTAREQSGHHDDEQQPSDQDREPKRSEDRHLRVRHDRNATDLDEQSVARKYRLPSCMRATIGDLCVFACGRITSPVFFPNAAIRSRLRSSASRSMTSAGVSTCSSGVPGSGDRRGRSEVPGDEVDLHRHLLDLLVNDE